MTSPADQTSLTPLEQYEAKINNVEDPKPRLPRVGCIWIFALFLLLSGIAATGYYHSAGEVAPSFQIPAERVSVTVSSDAQGILLPGDLARLETLAKDISGQADCSVAVMFIRARFADMMTIFDEVAADWAPEKGVLLICDVGNSTMRFGLIGSGWRLADWDVRTVIRKCSVFGPTERGARAIELLARLKNSLETAAKTAPESEEAENGEAASGADRAQAGKKNTALMTDEEIEAQIAAEDKAEKARIEAEDSAASDRTDPGDGSGDGSGDGDKKGKVSGILYSNVASRGGEGTARSFALGFLMITALFAVFALKNGYAARKNDIRRNPEILADYRKKILGNKSLRLLDTNEYNETGWTHRSFLKMIAIILGILFGLGSVTSTVMEEPQKDILRPASSVIPDNPGDGRIVDQAEVFTAEGKAMLSDAISHLEASTGGEIMVYTVATTGDVPIEEFSFEAARKWEIGKKGVDNGALLVLAIDDHRSRLEIGYGWEGPVNDARAGDLLRLITPDLQAERYTEAAVKVVRGVEQFVTGVSPADEEAAVSGDGAPAPKKVYEPAVRDYGTLTYAKPKNDPRVLNPQDSLWGLIGLFGCIIAAAAGYWGRIVMTSAPHLVIHDPTAVPVYTPSSSGGGSHRSSGSRSSSSRSSSSSSSRRSGGGGSFGGGGASGRW